MANCWYFMWNYLGNNTRPTTVGFDDQPWMFPQTNGKKIPTNPNMLPVTELSDVVREIKEHCRYSFFSSMTTWKNFAIPSKNAIHMPMSSTSEVMFLNCRKLLEDNQLEHDMQGKKHGTTSGPVRIAVRPETKWDGFNITHGQKSLTKTL